MAREVIDQIYRDTIKFRLDGRNADFERVNGTIFNAANADIADGNIKATNWPDHSFIYNIEGKIKELSHSQITLIQVNLDYTIFDITLPWMLKEILDNTFFTLKVNAKEYFRLMSLSQFCDPTMVARVVEMVQTSDGGPGMNYIPSCGITDNIKHGTGGVHLAVPIEINEGDTVQGYWQLGSVTANTMPLFFNHISGLGDFEWDPSGLYQTYFTFGLEMKMKGTEERVVQ